MSSISKLDAGLRARVRAEVREILRASGVTVVFVTHDQEEALSLADQVAVMQDGRIVQTASPEDLYWRPVNQEVATFVGDANILTGLARAGLVQCELGRLPAVGTLDGQVEIALRPERLVPRIDENGPGEVIDREFFGNHHILTTRLDSGAKVRSRLGPESAPRPGQRVAMEVFGEVMAFSRSDRGSHYSNTTPRRCF